MIQEKDLYRALVMWLPEYTEAICQAMNEPIQNVKHTNDNSVDYIIDSYTAEKISDEKKSRAEYSAQVVSIFASLGMTRNVYYWIIPENLLDAELQQDGRYPLNDEFQVEFNKDRYYFLNEDI